MQKLFETKGAQPQWEVIFAKLVEMNIGEIVKDDELQALLPDAPEGSVRSAFHRAVLHIEDDHRRTFDRVREVGYRMVAANEHESLARRQHKKAKRRIKSAVRKAHSADRSLLQPEERRRIDAVEDHLARQAEMIRRLDERVEKNEQRTARTEKDTDRLADRLDALQDLLRRHGIEDQA